MDITFHNIMPAPLSSIEHGEKSIWGKTFSLNQGEKIMLNASSGKGKSTFTSTIIGLRDDYEGKLTYDSNDIQTFSQEDWAKIRSEKISVVFQDLQLFGDLTVEENLNIKNNLTNTFTEEQLRAMLDKLGILDKWNVQSKFLSMGQRQRVAIIRALSQPFNWLFMDEPFSHLDEGNTQLCLELINQRCDELGAGFVLTTLGSDHGFTFDRELNL